MDVILNGESYALEQACNIDKLVETLQLEGKFAIEVNQTIVPRSEFPNTQLHAGDKIEIVQAIGGG
ncbi:MAG: sulfur carrier protein ThiS [Gammaproteobacteria bacterium]|jgi:sulfur carrier protein